MRIEELIMKPEPIIQDQAQYPRPLHVVGELITVLASGASTGSYEIFLQEGEEGSGPEPHYHPWDESFFVIRGEVNFNVDSDVPRLAVPGTLVHVPAGSTHWFRWQRGGGATASLAGHHERDLRPLRLHLRLCAHLGT
ncbi:MAG: cupin domain-containing protein [Burkholderiaceae bacterium]|nr:cupin domain-containing protein [Burkholderiaceae bacterium]